ncbi:protein OVEREXPRESSOR OF CATIONIC PEROXIDASE 3-like isoform X1 [Astyanax mexicanus]|uniref:Protein OVEREXPRESSOR OF CATIONIC PEROXIDASE 3-like isoform X1 n=1 Tax=Astyanax mexicanus TaxID=7994 RepID=A0A8T2KZY5_ASTMX|nr:protein OVEREXPRESSOR OF CATIONIC PEROXIDASE 3-like isoform X1 [Astyanax mexicanus]
MDSTAILSVVGGLFLLSIVILTGLCLHCKGNSQTKYTQQYQQSSQLNQGFTVIRPHAENPLTTTLPTQTSLHQLVTSPLLPDPRRHSACPSSNGEFTTNTLKKLVYEDDDFDDGPGYEIPPEKNQDDPEYLDVLPDDPHQSQHSLASSANSGQNYENVTEIHVLPRDGDVYVVGDEDDDDDNDDDDDDDDDQQYINVHQPNIDFQTPVGSYGSSDGHDSSDYVNAPVQMEMSRFCHGDLIFPDDASFPQ